MKYSIKTPLDILANQRDQNKCVECGRTTGIETHHIVPELEELKNLVTLCHSCHKKQHNMAGCFQPGPDSRREVGINNLVEANKTHYFNQYKNKWVERPKNPIRNKYRKTA